MSDRGIWAVLPVKSLSQGKRRLAACLTPTERRALIFALLGSTSESVRPFVPADQILVVSPDSQVLDWAGARGLGAHRQSGRGLNNAIHEVEREVIRAGGEVFLVLLPDLPLLTTADIERLLLRLEGANQVVIGVGQRGGTHALAIRPPGWLRFAFGPGSHQRHVAAALAAGGKVSEYESPGFSLDVDTAEDLMLALQMRPDLRVLMTEESSGRP